MQRRIHWHKEDQREAAPMSSEGGATDTGKRVSLAEWKRQQSVSELEARSERASEWVGDSHQAAAAAAA